LSREGDVHHAGRRGAPLLRVYVRSFAEELLIKSPTDGRRPLRRSSLPPNPPLPLGASPLRSGYYCWGGGTISRRGLKTQFTLPSCVFAVKVGIASDASLTLEFAVIHPMAPQRGRSQTVSWAGVVSLHLYEKEKGESPPPGDTQTFNFIL